MKVIPEPMDSIDLMDLEKEWECKETLISSEKNESSIYRVPDSEKDLTLLFNENI